MRTYFTYRSVALDIAVLLGGFIAALFAAPHVFNIMITIGRASLELQALRNSYFEDVASKTVVLLSFAAFMIILFGNRAYLSRIIWPMFKRNIWRFGYAGLFTGLASVFAISLAGYASGVYTLDASSGDVWARLPGAFMTGLAVGLFEELLFRGLLYHKLSHLIKPMGAAVLVSLIFAGIHLLKPVIEAPPVYGHWWTGWAALADAFHGQPVAHTLTVGTNLFILSLVLCYALQVTGSMTFIVCLHAGWIVALKLHAAILDLPAGDVVLFGRSEYMNEGLITSVMGLMLLLSLFVYSKKRRTV